MSDATRLYIEGPRVTARGLSYRARIGSAMGPIVVEASTEPLLAGSRALLAMGKGGSVELWDSVRPFPLLRGDIATLARLTVDEARCAFQRWRQFPVRRCGQGLENRGSGLSGTGQGRKAVLDETATDRRP
jgi:hypothetical protein